MQFVFATVPATQLESLIKLLVASCAVVSQGETNKELRALATSVMSGAKRAEQAMVIDVTSVLSSIVKGDEVDQDELKLRMKELRQAVREEVKTDRKFNHDTLDLLNCTSAYLINNGEPALRKMRSLVNELGVPALTQGLAPEAKSQKDFVKPLERIVQTVGKRKGTMLTKEEVETLKKKNPEVFKEYQRLRKNYNLVWKDEIAAFIVASKKKAVPYKDVLAYLNSKKIDHPLSTGFTGLIDANGRAYTTSGKAINGGIPTKDSGFTVQMNKNYNPKTDDQYVFTTLKADGSTSQHVYTVAYRKNKNTQKFEMVGELMKVIDKVHNTWIPYLRRADFSPACVAATALELMYTFSARVGNKDNQTLDRTTGKAVSTYGISTLEARHFKISGSKIIIAYLGKDAVRQVHQIDGGAGPEAKLLVKNLQLYVANKLPKERVFQCESPATGKLRPMTSAGINFWFEKLGSPVTCHKLRHVKGTQIFLEQMKKNASKMKEGMKQGEGDKLFLQMCSQVGAALGHVRGVGKQQKVTPATAIKNYIDPTAMLSFYEALQLRPPRLLAKIK